MRVVRKPGARCAYAQTYTVCSCLSVKLCPSTHTSNGRSMSVLPQTFSKCCASFSVLCMIPLTVAPKQCLGSDSSPSVNKVHLHRHLPCPTQQGLAWRSRTWQHCWVLKVSMPLQESSEKPRCISGFSLCISGETELHPHFCLPPSVDVNLTFGPQEIFQTAVQSWSAASLHVTLFVYLCMSKPKLISAHVMLVRRK